MNPFQKITRVLIAVLAVLVFTAGIVSAAVPTTRTLTVGSGSGTAGQTADVLIPITIDYPDGVGGVAFTIGYNKDVFTFNGIEPATTGGWPIKDPETFKVTTDPVTGYAYYNPYKKEAPYDARTYDLAPNATLFYQFNDLKDAQNRPIGRVLVSGASAVPLTGTMLFKAKFLIKSTGINGTTYPIQLTRSIINNPAAGYAVDTIIPALVSAGELVDGKYTSLNFPVIPALFVNGGITVSATTYTLGGTVTYATTPTATNAVGCTVVLKKEVPAGSNTYVFNSQATVGADGKYLFTGKDGGKYMLSVNSLDPSYNNYDTPSGSEITLAANKTDANVVLAAKPQPTRVSGTVTSGNIPGLLVKVVDPSNNVMGTFSVAIDGTWSTPLLPHLTSGAYGWYLVYGSLTSAKDATTFDTSVLKTISGSITGLPDGGGAVTVISTAGKITKTVQVAKNGSNPAAYTIGNLVAASDYIVSAVATGLPLTYYNGKTDVNEATPVDISSANATAIDFNFVPPASHITGTIKDAGTGLGATAVYAFDVNTFALISTQTGAGGAFDLSVPQGSYEIFVIKGNGKIFYFYNTDGTPTQNESSAVLRVVTANNQTLADTNIYINECDKTLSGKVTYRTSNGDPAANVLVTVSNATKRAMGLTGQDGKYAIGGLCAEAYSVEMKPLTGNYPVQTASITAGTNTTQDFVIDTGAVLSGKVTVDNISGAAVPGAMLYLKDKATGALVGGRIFFSAADGTYSISIATTDIQQSQQSQENNGFTLEVTHPDYQGYTVNLVIGSDMTQNVFLTKGAFFNGTVTDNSTAKPLASATIIVMRAGATPVYTVTNSTGAYSVYGLDAGVSTYIIIAQRKGYERQAATSKKPETSVQASNTVDFALAPPAQYYTVSGTVTTDAPAAVPNAIVLVSAFSNTKSFFASTTTDADGKYSVGNLVGSTTYNIVVIPPALPTQTSTVAIASSDVANKNFTIAVGKDIGGTVSSTTTIPGTTKIYVFLYKGGVYKGFQVAGTNGAYLFKGLADGNDYKVFAVASGYTPQWYGGASVIGSATAIDITGGTVNNANIQLVKP